MNSKVEGVKAEFYSGGGRDEKPVAVIIDDRKLGVVKVIREEKIGCEVPEGGYYRVFTVKTEDGSEWEIREEPGTPGGWVVTLKSSNNQI